MLECTVDALCNRWLDLQATLWHSHSTIHIVAHRHSKGWAWSKFHAECERPTRTPWRCTWCDVTICLHVHQYIPHSRQQVKCFWLVISTVVLWGPKVQHCGWSILQRCILWRNNAKIQVKARGTHQHRFDELPCGSVRVFRFTQRDGQTMTLQAARRVFASVCYRWSLLFDKMIYWLIIGHSNVICHVVCFAAVGLGCVVEGLRV